MGISQLFAGYKDATKDIPYLMENTELILNGIKNVETAISGTIWGLTNVFTGPA